MDQVKRKIILISGKQGSGKTTLAFNIVKLLNGQATQLKFADTIYVMHDACLPILKHNGIRPQDMRKDGELLQVLGTEYGRKRIGEDVWVKDLRARADRFLQFDEWVVIDDARFENEFDAFPDAIRVRLEASEECRKARCSYWRDDTAHPSETGLDAYAADHRFDILISSELSNMQQVLEAVTTHAAMLVAGRPPA